MMLYHSLSLNLCIRMTAQNAEKLSVILGYWQLCQSWIKIWAGKRAENTVHSCSFSTDKQLWISDIKICIKNIKYFYIEFLYCLPGKI